MVNQMLIHSCTCSYSISQHGMSEDVELLNRYGLTVPRFEFENAGIDIV